MLIPRYYFSNDYTDFYEYFLTQPHTRKTFRKNDCLWNPVEPVTHVYYITVSYTHLTLPTKLEV